MRKATLILLVLVLVLVGCKNDVVKYGNLSINTLPNNGLRTIEPNLASVTCASYVVKGTHSNGTDTFEQEFTTSSVTVENLLVGNWTVYVEGYNSDDVKIAESASQTVVINPTNTTNASFVLDYLTSGSGTLSLALKISSSDTAVAKVVFAIDDEQVTVPRPDTATGDYFVFSTEQTLLVGQYDILVSLYDANDTRIGVSLMEVAHVHNSLTSAKEWNYFGFTASPTFSPVAGLVTLSNQISISSATQGAIIYYTTDGSTPTKQSPVYSSPFTLSKNTTIKAVSFSNLLFPSPVIIAEYHIKAAAPTANVAAGTYESARSISLNTATTGSTIYYTTDGSTPTSASSVFNGSIRISNNTIVKAITKNPDFDDSDVSIFEYHIKTATPTSSVVADAYEEPQSVVLSCATPNSTIYYTTDGTDPTNESTQYTGAITVSESQTIKAIAYSNGYDPSPIFSEEIVIATEKVGAVTFNVASGTYNTNQSVELSAPAGTTIYYTTDGSTPTRASTQYISAITVSSSTTIKAIAGKWGYLNSDPVTASYVIKTKNPSMSVAEGRYQTAQSVVLSCDTAGALIYYTLDGSTPTTASTRYTGAITVSSSQTIKAIAKYAQWDCSDVVSVNYQIDGLAGFRVTNPTHYSLSIDVPDDWVEGEPVVESVKALLSARMTPDSINASYNWYLDGDIAINNNGTSNTDSYLCLGTGDFNISLLEGIHSITVEATVGSTKLIDEVLLIVTNDASIGNSGICYPEYAIGDRSRSGGFVVYDCDADNTEEDPDGPDNLLSSDCGWRYLEAAPTDICMIDDVPTIGATAEEFLNSGAKKMFGFGYIGSVSSSNGSFVFTPRTVGASYSSIGGGQRNTEIIVGAFGSSATISIRNYNSKISDYAAKICYCLEYTVDNITYDDWFLPDLMELRAMRSMFRSDGLGDFSSDNYYWSSSESGAETASVVYFGDTGNSSSDRNQSYRVRPARTF